jgi:hypothetical protein
MKTMESISSDVQVLRLRGTIEQLQDADAFPAIFDADPPCLSREVDLFKAFVFEATDHITTVSRAALCRQRFG